MRTAALGEEHDQVIQREAVTNRGIYNPTAHLRKLGDMPIAIDGRWVFPAAVVEVNQRRLERLARYKLVAKVSDGTCRVPPNLVDLLRSREQTHPQFRLQVEQIRLHVDRGQTRGPSLGR